MKQRVSVRGRMAYKLVRFATGMPVLGELIQNGDLRRRMQGKERRWKCPSHLQWEKIPQKRFGMEYLHAKDKEMSQYVILQLHGGGYYNRMRNKYREFAALYYEVSGGMDVLTPDYRVAPEHRYPAALYDACSAYIWLLKKGYQPEHIVLAGDSAGGGLALALIHYLKAYKLPIPGAVITMSAWTDLTKKGESYRTNYWTDPVFGRRKKTLVYRKSYYQKNQPWNPYISPVKGDFKDFPAMLMQVGEYEMLLSDTLEVVKKAKKQGVPVTLQVYKGMFHVFQMGELCYPESKRAWVQVGRFLRKWKKNN